jgi:hypothetical protein
VKKVPSSLPSKFPKNVEEGKSMDYSDSNLAFPKPKKKEKKSKWGKK